VAAGQTAVTFYLVLPFVSTEAQEADEISERELEAVAGAGSGPPTRTCIPPKPSPG
jgi:hypothetical protein